MDETTVVLGLEDPALQEEVLHFLDRRPRIRVVAAVPEKAGLARAIREAGPDAAVVSPSVAASGDLDGAAVFVVGERETTEALRGAIRAGARGFYLWPEERETLGRDTERVGRHDAGGVTRMGRVVAVYGARGGAGTTFVRRSGGVARGFERGGSATEYGPLQRS